MDEIQAAVLNVKLQYPENEQKARHRQIQLYLEHLDDDIKDRCIAAKLISPAHENVFDVFPFLTRKRDQLKAFLAGEWGRHKDSITSAHPIYSHVIRK